MGIWNEIQEQLKELQQLLDERKETAQLVGRYQQVTVYQSTKQDISEEIY